MNLRTLLCAAAFGVTALVLQPAWACDHDKNESAKKELPAVGTDVTLVGSVKDACPMAKMKRAKGKRVGCDDCIALVKSDEERYMLVKDDKAKELLKAAGSKAQVEVTGTVVEQHGKSMVRIKSYRLITSST